MEIKHVFIVVYFLTIQALNTRSDDDDQLLKCVPSYGYCKRLKNFLESDALSLDMLSEVLLCKPGEMNNISLVKKKKPTCCIRDNATSLMVYLVSGHVGQASFFDASNLIGNFNSTSFITLFLLRVSGINVETPLNPLGNSTGQTIEFHIEVIMSTVEFFDNKGEPVRTCAQFERLESYSSTFSYLLNLGENQNQTIQQFKFNYVRYANEPVCESVFNNTRIEYLIMSYLIQTFLKTNVPRFVKSNANAHINSYIDRLLITGFYADLTDSLIPAKVLEFIQLILNFLLIRFFIFYFKGLWLYDTS